MSVEKKCFECSVIIVDEWFFACKGFMCDKVISYTCATSMAKKLMTKFPNDVKKAMKLIFNGLPGLSWFCPDCITNMKVLHSKSLSSSKTISQGSDYLNNDTHTVSEVSNETVENRRVTRSQSKTQRENNTILPTASSKTLSTDIPVPSMMKTLDPLKLLPETSNSLSTPTSAICLPVEVKPASVTASVVSVGTEDNNQHNRLTDDVRKNKLTRISKDGGSMNPIPLIAEALNDPLTDDSDDLNIRVVQPRRWLFVSRIHCSVSELQFKKLLNKIVSAENVYVAQRITPKSSNGMKYDYISYKINIPGEAFNSVVNSKLWPDGLLVKEFERCQKRSFFQRLGPHHPPR